MIKATELRIGNLIYNTMGQVNKVNLDALKYIKEQKGIHQAKPIFLTEQWIINFGFNSISENTDGTKNYWSKELDASIDVETHILSSKIEIGLKYRIFERKRTKSIVYVHELQNLYFALTGKELKFEV